MSDFLAINQYRICVSIEVFGRLNRRLITVIDGIGEFGIVFEQDPWYLHNVNPSTDFLGQFKSNSISHSGHSGLGSRSGRSFSTVAVLEVLSVSGCWVEAGTPPAPGLNGLSTASLNRRTLRLPKPGQAESCSGEAWTILENDCKTQSVYKSL